MSSRSCPTSSSHTLKGVAAYYGYEPSCIDELLDVGFSTDEIEELLYERMIY